MEICVSVSGAAKTSTCKTLAKLPSSSKWTLRESNAALSWKSYLSKAKFPEARSRRSLSNCALLCLKPLRNSSIYRWDTTTPKQSEWQAGEFILGCYASSLVWKTPSLTLDCRRKWRDIVESTILTCESKAKTRTKRSR